MANSNVRNVRFRIDIDEWLKANFPENITDGVNAIIDQVMKGELVPKSPNAIDKDKDELAKELLAVTIAIKKNINERQELEKQYLFERVRNLQLRNNRMEQGPQPTSRPAPAQAQRQVQQQTPRRTFDCINGCGQKLYWPAGPTKDNPNCRPLEDATSLIHYCPNWKPKQKKAEAQQIATGLLQFKCSSCPEEFNADIYLNLERDAIEHVSEKHHRELTSSEIRQLHTAEETGA